MTRQQFEDEVESFGDLMDFCSEHGLWDLDEVCDDDAKDEYIDEDLRECDWGWLDIRDALDNIPTGYDWYRRNGYLDFDALDEYDFEHYKEDVFNHAEESGCFDEEEEEQPEPEEHSGETDEEAERRRAGYYFTDPMTGEVFVAGYAYAAVQQKQLDEFFV